MVWEKPSSACLTFELLISFPRLKSNKGVHSVPLSFWVHHLGSFDTYRDASLVQLILTYLHMKPFYVGCPLLLPSIGIVWSCVERNSAGLSHHQEKKGPMSFGYLDGFGVSLPQDASGK